LKTDNSARDDPGGSRIASWKSGVAESAGGTEPANPHSTRGGRSPRHGGLWHRGNAHPKVSPSQCL